MLAQRANLALPELPSLSHHLLFLDLFAKMHLGITTSPAPYFKKQTPKQISDFSGAAVHCQQNKRTCRRPECPGNQATFGCAPAPGFFSFSSTQWPLAETNHLTKICCTTTLFTEIVYQHGSSLLFSGLLLTGHHCVPLLRHPAEDYVMENVGMTCR